MPYRWSGYCYNTKKKSKESNTQTRHSLEREPPLPVYIGLNIHGLTRCKRIIQQSHELGISISYDRVIQLEEWIAEAICERFDKDGVKVCSLLVHWTTFTITPPQLLQKALFMVPASVSSSFQMRTNRVKVDHQLRFLQLHLESTFSLLIQLFQLLPTLVSLFQSVTSKQQRNVWIKQKKRKLNGWKIQVNY